MRWVLGTKSRSVLIGLFAVLLSAGMYWFNQEASQIRHIPFFEKQALDQVNFRQLWESFRQKAGISEDARIKDYKLVYDQQGQIESLRFSVLDPMDSGYLKHTYHTCRACEDQEKSIFSTAKQKLEGVDHHKNIEADRFFTMLDTVFRDRSWHREGFSYYLAVSEGVPASVALPGTYYALAETEMRPLPFAEGKDRAVEGVTMQIIGADSPGPFSTDEHNAVNILLEKRSGG